MIGASYATNTHRPQTVLLQTAPNVLPTSREAPFDDVPFEQLQDYQQSQWPPAAALTEEQRARLRPKLLPSISGSTPFILGGGTIGQTQDFLGTLPPPSLPFVNAYYELLLDRMLLPVSPAFLGDTIRQQQQRFIAGLPASTLPWPNYLYELLLDREVLPISTDVVPRGIQPQQLTSRLWTTTAPPLPPPQPFAIQSVRDPWLSTLGDLPRRVTELVGLWARVPSRYQAAFNTLSTAGIDAVPPGLLLKQLDPQFWSRTPAPLLRALVNSLPPSPTPDPWLTVLGDGPRHLTERIALWRELYPDVPAYNKFLRALTTLPSSIDPVPSGLSWMLQRSSLWQPAPPPPRSQLPFALQSFDPWTGLLGDPPRHLQERMALLRDGPPFPQFLLPFVQLLNTAGTDAVPLGDPLRAITQYIAGLREPLPFQLWMRLLLTETYLIDTYIPPPVGPTVYYQRGDGKRKRRKRRQIDRLFAEIEATLRREVSGEAVPGPLIVPGTPAGPQLDLSQGYEAALDQILRMAGEHEELSTRLAQVRLDIATYELRQRWLRDLDEDDDAFFFS